MGLGLGLWGERGGVQALLGVVLGERRQGGWLGERRGVTYCCPLISPAKYRIGT